MKKKVRVCDRTGSLLRHSGLDPESRKVLTVWIPAFAGMTN